MLRAGLWATHCGCSYNQFMHRNQEILWDGQMYIKPAKLVTVRVFADCSQGWKSTFEAVNLHDPDIIQQTIITTFFSISGG